MATGIRKLSVGLVLTTVLLFGQASSSGPSFEVASIKAAALQETGRVSTRMSVDRVRVNYTNVSVTEVIEQAYRVQDYQIEGPEWLGTNRFDIAAKIPEGAARSQIPLMFQTLLADRFKLELRHEIRQLPVYALMAGKNGPKLKQAESATGTSGEFGAKRSRVNAKISMADLAEFLSKQVRRPVLDMTGLNGAFEFTLDWAPDSATDEPAPSLFTAVQEQLGLKLESQKAPVEILVVGRVEKPSEN